MEWVSIMKVHVSRIFAVMVFGILIISGIYVFVPQNSEPVITDSIEKEPYLNPDPFPARPTRAGTPWPMHLQNPTHSSFTPDSGPITNDVLWDSPTGGDTYGSPAIVDDIVYIGGGDGGGGHAMNAFYANNGTLKWRTDTIANVPGGYGLTSSPAVDNGYVFFGGDRLYCLWANNGTIKWTIWTTAGPGASWGDGTPTVANNKVFMPADDRKLYCLEQDTGNVIWTFQTSSSGSANYGLFAPPAVANGYVYLSACDYNVYQIRETQATSIAVAENIFNMPYTSYSAPVVANGRVFVGCGYVGRSTSNRFYCLDATDLSLIWEFYPGISTSFFSSAGFYNDRIYIGALDGNLYCLDAMSSGPSTTVYWQYNMGANWSSPAITNDRLYIGSKSNYLYCFNLSQPVTPSYYWRYLTTGDVDSSPAVSDGKVYVGSLGGGGTLYCFGTSSTPPTVDSIEIRDQPDGLGNPILDQTIDVGTQIIGYAAAYNDSSGYISDIPVFWFVTNGSGANASTFPTGLVNSSIFYSGYFGGDATWYIDDGAGHVYFVQITIRSPTVEYIKIVDTGSTGSLEIQDQTVDVGFSTRGYAASYNASIGYLDDIIVNWSVVNTGSEAFTTPLQDSNSLFNANLTGGSATWTADDGNGHSDSVIITIRDPTVDDIIIVDTPDIGSSEIIGQTVDVGYSIIGYVAGFNETAGYIGDVPVTWSVVNTSGAEGFTNPISGASSTFSAGMRGGTVEWIADYSGGITDSIIYSVRQPNVDYIIIRSGPNGTGSWIGDSTFIFGSSEIFYAAGYNDTAGWITDVDAQWESDNPTFGNVTSGPSNQTTFDAHNNGTCQITATYNLLSNSTGIITIINYTIDYIVIRDEPGGQGAWVGDRDFTISATAFFYAAAYNLSAGYLGDVGCEWISSNETVAAVTTPGTSTQFSVQFVAGECNVTATFEGVLSNYTGKLTVLDAEIDYIQITDAPNGNEVIDVVLNVGENILLYASAYNISGPTYLGPISVDWSQSPSIGLFNPTSGTLTFFTAGDSGGSTIINATNSVLLLSDEFNLTINDPQVDYIIIRDAADGFGIPVSSVSFTLGDIVTDTYFCAGYNSSIGYLEDVSAEWIVNGDIGSVNPSTGTSTEFNATTVGSGNVTVTYNSISLSINITVNPEQDTTPPETPTGLQVQQVISGEALYLTWNENTENDLAGYNIYRSTTNGSGFILVNIDLVTDNFYLDTGLDIGTTYYYNITAVDDSDNESPHSETVNNTCDVDTDVDGVFNLEDSDDDNDRLLDEEEPAIGTDPLLWDTDGDDYSDYDDDYPLDPTKWERPDVPPDAPTGLIVTPLSQGNALSISWDANTEEDLAGYNIYRSLLPDREFEKQNTDLITSENYVDASLTNGVRYYYYVEAIDVSDLSSESSDIEDGMPDIDTDGDGKPNYEDDDDDGDGLLDTQEIEKGTDPLLKDTDGDGHDDAEDYYPTNADKWQKPEDGGLPILLLLLPIIVVIVLLLLFVILKKRKPESVPPPTVAPQKVLPPPPPGIPQRDLPPPPSGLKPSESATPSEEQFPQQGDDELVDEDAVHPPDDEEEPPPPDDEDLPPPDD
jgi:outer membrane protein assembly factor BamB